ncbi:hypothetical protein J6590_014295 [Homalodisca vitripennis]|nr:hypothetical protein J6590_014295 [Homalodisca vitripennis]
MLEDVRGEPNRQSAPALETALRRPAPSPAPPRPASAPDPTEASVTLPLRRLSRPASDDKEQDKENDIRNAQATQAVIQRRRRPKRRSTGVVHVDMDEIDPERQDMTGGGGGDGEEVHINSTELDAASDISTHYHSTQQQQCSSVYSTVGTFDYHLFLHMNCKIGANRDFVTVELRLSSLAGYLFEKYVYELVVHYNKSLNNCERGLTL